MRNVKKKKSRARNILMIIQKKSKDMNLIYVSKCHTSPKYLPLPVLYICANFLRTAVLISLAHHICSIIGHAKSRMRLKMVVKEVKRWVSGGSVVWRGVEVIWGVMDR